MKFHMWSLSRFASLARAVLPLWLLSALLVACSSGQPARTDGVDPANNPVVTVTIRLGVAQQAPTPAQPGYTCGAWARDTSPSTKSKTVGVYALFKQNVNGNPVGVDGATAVATVLWPDGATATLTALTTADGLAKFGVPLNNKSAINGVTLVTVNFTKEGVPPCSVQRDRAAFFTIVAPTSVPTPPKGHR